MRGRRGGLEVTERSDTQSVSKGRPRGRGGVGEGETPEAVVGNTAAVNATRTACGKLLVAFMMISSSYRYGWMQMKITICRTIQDYLGFK